MPHHKPQSHHHNQVQRPNDGLNAAQRRKQRTKEETALRLAAEALKNKLARQNDRWLGAKVYASEDKMWRPIKLHLEYQKAGRQKTFPASVRDRLDDVFVAPGELREAWRICERERDDARRREGVGPGEWVDDWFEKANRPTWYHGWKWWSALAKLDADFRTTFFRHDVGRWDDAGLPVYVISNTSKTYWADVPDFSNEYVKGQWQIFVEEQKTLREGEALLQHEAEGLQVLFAEMDVKQQEEGNSPAVEGQMDLDDI